MPIFKADEERVCASCGTEMVYFVQHAHGNYPLLDYVCPRCDLGIEEGEPSGGSAHEGEGAHE